MSLKWSTPCDCEGFCPYADPSGWVDCESNCGAEEPVDIPEIEEESEEQTSSAPEESESDDAWRVLLQLRDAQESILSAMWDVDEQTNLEKALTLIGDKMDEISRAYGLPIMSEQ